MGLTTAGTAATDPETIRRTAEQVLGRPEFQLDPRPETGTTILEWTLRVFRWIIEPFRWLFNAMEGLPDILRWLIVVGLFAALVLLVLHIAYTIVQAVAGPARVRGLSATARAAPRDPSSIERGASEAAARGDYLSAIRLLFAACLLRLEAAEKQIFRPGTTNREHLKRHRKSPVFEPMKVFVDTIETRWYGQGECGPDDFEACLAAHARIRDLAQEHAHAHRA